LNLDNVARHGKFRGRIRKTICVAILKIKLQETQGKYGFTFVILCKLTVTKYKG